MNEWTANWIETFKKDLGDEVYKAIELESNLIGRKVQLKTDIEFIGVITCLWLPKNENRFRKDDLWCVDWDNGKFGVIEIKQISFL